MNYKFVKAPQEYPGPTYSWRNRILEHHLVWWENTGELVESGYIIHHKNGIKSDNRFCNLEKMTNEDHLKHHHTIHPTVIRKCGFCKKSISTKNIEASVVYCSRRCSSNGNRSSKLSEHTKEQIKKLRSDGLSCYKISELLNIARNTVMKYWK